MKEDWPAILIGIVIVGTCIGIAGACDFWLCTNYLRGIRETEKRLNEEWI